MYLKISNWKNQHHVKLAEFEDKKKKSLGIQQTNKTKLL